MDGLGIDGIAGLNGGIQAVAQHVQLMLYVLAQPLGALLVEGVAGGLLLGLAEDILGLIRHLAGELPLHGVSPLFRLELEWGHRAPQNARIQKTADTAVNTVTISTSDHPHFSKWWWRGAILKMRLPWVSLK